jgi:hypothetical protein
MNYKIDNFTKKHTNQAEEWFKLHDILTFVYDSNIYISVGNFEFKLCNSEVRYRAELYKRLKENNLINK